MFYKDSIFYERREPADHFKTSDEFYRELVKVSHDRGKMGLHAEMVAEWSHSTFGRRRWRISKEMAQILYEIPIDPDMSNITWPYDAWSLCFEEGTKIEGIPYRWMRLFSARSKMARDLLFKKLNVVDNTTLTATFQCDSGLNELGEPENDVDDPLILFRTIDLTKYNPYTAKATVLEEGYGAIQSKEHLAEHARIMNVMAKVCASAMLLYAARPDVLVPAPLTKNERRGGWNGSHNMTFPSSKRIVAPSATPNESTGRTVVNHYRGWVLRTLRHERFKRSPDGSLRVILVEPCEVNPKHD